MAIEPLSALFDESEGVELPLPPELLAFHGPLRMPARADRPHVFTNFVTTLDGIVSVDPPRGTGAEISRGDLRDRALMGLLRAVADAVVIGHGNLLASSGEVWTADWVCPELAAPYARLRAALGKTAPPLQVVVTGRGGVDPGLAVFSGKAPAVVVTTALGAARLGARAGSARVAVAQAGHRAIPLAGVLRSAGVGAGARVLVESGPTSMTGFLAEGAIDELFLTRSPMLVGRSSRSAPGAKPRSAPDAGSAAEPTTLGLVEGQVFPPAAMTARLLSAHRGGDYLFLRYAVVGDRR